MDKIILELFALFKGDEPLFRKFMNLLIILTLIALGIFALESAMGLVTLGRLERQVNLLKELNAITETGLGNQQELETVFEDVVDQLENYQPVSIHSTLNTVARNNNVTFVEILAGGFVWFLVSPAMLFNKTVTGIATRFLGTFILISIGILFGFITASVVETSNDFISFILNLVAGLILIAIFALVYNFYAKRNQSQPEDVEKLPLPEDQTFSDNQTT